MMTFILTIVLTLLFLLVFILVLYLSSRPRRTLTREAVLELLDARLTGLDDDTAWTSYLSVPIHYDALLEEVRLRCLRVENDEQLETNRSLIGKLPLSSNARHRYQEIREHLLYHYDLRC